MYTINPGSQQAHNQSNGHDKDTKHSEQGIYLAETSLCSENTVQGLVRFSIFGYNLVWLLLDQNVSKTLVYWNLAEGSVLVSNFPTFFSIMKLLSATTFC